MSGREASLRYRQHTLRRPAYFIGIGLHSGRQAAMVVRPAAVDSGISFLRRDIQGAPREVPARWYRVASTDLSTTLSNEEGVSVATVEHLLAALRGCGIDNALVELDGPEVPIMDGSADPFVQVFRHVGTTAQDAPRSVIWIHRPVEVHDRDRIALLTPAAASQFTVSIDFDTPLIGAQSLSLALDDVACMDQLARARTFGFRAQLEHLQARGLALGGSLNNAILVDGDRVVNEGGLRFADEFVRHKLLDCIGDLSLAGAPIMGHFYAHRPGHVLNQALLAELFMQRDAWTRLPWADFDALWRTVQEQAENADPVRGRPGTLAH